MTFGEWYAQQGAWDWAGHAAALVWFGLSLYYALRRRHPGQDNEP